MVKTHGWVLPGSSGSNHLFAVCWNGLVYPVVSVRAQTNFQADTESLINYVSTNRSRMNKDFYGRAFPEKTSVATDSLLPIKACLLLRLGQNDLAAKIWNAYEISLRRQNFGQEQPEDPYLMLAGDWAWALFDRAICAHMRGDVPLALVSARQLAQIQPKIEAEAAKRGFPHPNYNDSLKHDQERPYLYFLDQLPQLLSDLERRAHEPKERSVIEISEWLFNNTNSPWAKLPWQRSTFHDPIDSDLVKLPAFRKLLAREMENQVVVGSMQWQSGIGINIRYNLPQSSGGYHFDWPDEESPTNGTKVGIRRCDWIAWKLAKSKQIPFFNPFETIEKRDEAIKNAETELIKSN